MTRTRAQRRYKNYTKARCKRDIDLSSYWWYYKPKDLMTFQIDGRRCGFYDNLHQYSKNKIHCSCPDCSPRTRNKGRHRNTKNYAPSINYGMMDKRRQMAMDEDVKILERTKEMKYVCFWGGNGYCGCDYEEYQSFEDGIDELEIDLISNEIAYQNAESYEYMVTDRSSDGEYNDIEDYYDDALSYCGWNYCTKEEFEMNVKE